MRNTLWDKDHYSILQSFMEIRKYDDQQREIPEKMVNDLLNFQHSINEFLP